MSSAATCPVCGRSLEQAAPAGEVVVGALSAVVDGAGVLVCPDGHHSETVPVELAARLTEAVREALLASRRTRVRRQLRCGACDTELTVPGRRTVRSVSADIDGAGIVRVTFDLPMLRCPGCGREQLPAEVAERDVADAVSAALAPGSPGRP